MSLDVRTAPEAVVLFAVGRKALDGQWGYHGAANPWIAMPLFLVSMTIAAKRPDIGNH